MRTRLVALAFALAAASAGTACAMSPAADPARCRVIGAEKLPADSGGGDGLCTAIERAAAARAPGVAYSVEVRVRSAYGLAATLTTGDGRKLPEQNLRISDRTLTRGSLQRFAEALAGQLASAVSR